MPICRVIILLRQDRVDQQRSNSGSRFAWREPLVDFGDCFQQLASKSICSSVWDLIEFAGSWFKNFELKLKIKSSNFFTLSPKDQLDEQLPGSSSEVFPLQWKVSNEKCVQRRKCSTKSVQRTSKSILRLELFKPSLVSSYHSGCSIDR